MPAFVGARRALISVVISGLVLDPDAASFVSRFTVPPTGARATAINQLVVALKASSLWTKLAVLHLHAAADPLAACLNLLGTSFTATQVNAPDFATDRGFMGDGATSYLDVGAGYAAMAPATLADITDLVWSLTDLNSTGRDAGAATTANNLIIGRTGSNQSARSGSATGINAPLGGATLNSLGLYGYARTGTSVDMVRNGSVLSTTTDTASAFATGNVNTLRGGSIYSTRRIAVRVIGRYLAASEQAALYGALQSYMQAVGAA